MGYFVTEDNSKQKNLYLLITLKWKEDNGFEILIIFIWTALWMFYIYAPPVYCNIDIVIIESVKCLVGRCRDKSKWCILFFFQDYVILFNYWKGLTYFDGLVLSCVNFNHAAISHFKLKTVKEKCSARSELFSFSWKLLWWTNSDSLIFDIVANYGSEHSVSFNRIIILWWFVFISGFKVMSVSLRFFFFFRLRLSTCQSEHLCKLLVSLTAIHVFKYLLSAFNCFFWTNEKQSCPVGTMFFYQVLYLLCLNDSVCWLFLLISTL